MKSAELLSIFKQGHLVIPLYFLQQYKKFNISLEEFVFLMYLYQLGDKSLFDPSKYQEELNIDLSKVMEYISKLTDKKLIEVDVVKNDKGLMEEVVLLDGFYRKLSLVMVEDNNEKSKEYQSNIFEVIEKEFGRTLSPIEYEIIKSWIDNDMSEELIREAIKEATFSGVSNLRYIDKILYEWTKKGYKKPSDIKRKPKKETPQEDLFEYDWLDEND